MSIECLTINFNNYWMPDYQILGYQTQLNIQWPRKIKLDYALLCSVVSILLSWFNIHSHSLLHVRFCSITKRTNANRSIEFNWFLVRFCSIRYTGIISFQIWFQRTWVLSLNHIVKSMLRSQKKMANNWNHDLSFAAPVQCFSCFMQSTSKAIVYQGGLQDFLKSSVNVHFTNAGCCRHIISMNKN